MEDKIILKFKTKNILNFYEIEPRIYKISAARLEESWCNRILIKWNTHVLGMCLIWFWGKGLCLSSLDQDEKLSLPKT